MRSDGIPDSGLGIRRIPNPKSPIPILICGAVLLCGAVVDAQPRRPRAEVTPLIESTAVRAGTPVRAALRVVLPEGLHTQSNKPRDPLLIPTVLTIDAPAGVTWDEVVFPPATDFNSAGQDQPLAVFEHEFMIGVKFTLAGNVATGDILVPAHLRYPASDANLRYPPATANTEGTLKVVPAPEVVTPNPDAL